METRILPEPVNPVAEFVDNYGETRVIHRKRGRRLSVFNGGDTPVLRMNRAAAILSGGLIKQKRIERGLTARELCLRAGFVDVNPKQRIYALENATREQGVRLGTLYALAHALECDVSDLLPSLPDVLKLAGVRVQELKGLTS